MRIQFTDTEPLSARGLVKQESCCVCSFSACIIGTALMDVKAGIRAAGPTNPDFIQG